MEHKEEYEDDETTLENIKASQNALITLINAAWFSNPVLMFSSLKEPIVFKPYTDEDRADIDQLYDETGGLQDGSESEGNSKVYDFHNGLRLTLFLAREASTQKLVGLASIDWSALQVKAGLLTNLLVLTSRRRQGIGSLLIQYQEAILQKLCFSEVHAMIKVKNRSSRELFRRMGYSIIFDGELWSRRPFIEFPEIDCNKADDCIVVCKSL